MDETDAHLDTSNFKIPNLGSIDLQDQDTKKQDKNYNDNSLAQPEPFESNIEHELGSQVVLLKTQSNKTDANANMFQ